MTKYIFYTALREINLTCLKMIWLIKQLRVLLITLSVLGLHVEVILSFSLLMILTGF